MWYKIPWLNFKSASEVFLRWEIILKLCVCMPYKVIKKKSEKHLVAQRPGLLKILEMAVTYGIIYYAQHLRYTYIDPDDFVSFYGIIAQYNVLSFVACTSTLIFLFTHKHFVTTINLLRKIDKGLNALGVEMFYNYWFLLCCSYAANIIFLPIMVNATPRTWMKIIIDVIAFHQAVIIRFAIMVHPVMLMGMIYEHFLKLNQQLNKLLHDDIDDDGEALFNRTIWNTRYQPDTKDLNPEFILDLATVIHEDLVLATVEVLKGFGLIILLNAATNITQVVLGLLFIYAGNYKEVSPLELSISFALYTVQMGILYLLGFLIEKEAKNTFVALGHYNSYYLDEQLAIKKNTSLFQGIHHNIDLKVVSVIPLNPSIFLRQISICSTLFLIVLQFYRKSESS